MIPVPTLAEVVADPGRAAGLPAFAILDVLHALLGVERALLLHLSTALLLAEPEPDEALTPEQAAAIIGVSPHTMRKWLRTPRYAPAVTVRTPTLVRVSRQKLKAIMDGEGARRKAAWR